MKKIIMITLSVFLVGCSAQTSNQTSNQTSEQTTQDSNYEYRIIQDPTTGVLTAFYEKDGNLYYKQITEIHTSGDNLTLPNGGWTEMEPPADDAKFYQIPE